MKIEVWSDYVCPFCYIGKRRLELALDTFPHRDQVEVEFRSFELDPNSPRDVRKNIHEVLAEKYGMSLEAAKKANEQVGIQASEVGLDYHFSTMIPTNTFDAHRLTKYAKTFGKDKEITEKLLYAYFTESKHIGDHETLATIAADAGLERTETLSILRNQNAYANDVRSDEAIARQIGVTGVPFFVFNQKYAITGAQPIETFTNALNKVWEETCKNTTLEKLSADVESGGYCTDDSCDIPVKQDKNGL